MRDFRLKQALYISLLAFVIFGACSKDAYDFDEISFESSDRALALPLLKGTFTITDILVGDSIDDIRINSTDQGISLAYSSELLAVEMNQSISTPNTSINQVYLADVNDATNLTAGNDISFSGSVDSLFPISGPLVTEEIEFKSGELVIEVSSSFRYVTNADVTIQGLLVDGLPATYSFQLVHEGVTNPTQSLVIDLEDAVLSLGTAFSQSYTVRYDAEVQQGGANGPAAAGDQFVLQTTFRNLEYKKVTGNATSFDFDIPQDSIPLNVFERANNGSLQLNNPSFNLSSINRVGAAFDLTIDTLQSIDDETQEVKILSNTGDLTLDMRAGSLSAPTADELVVTNDNTNGGLSELLSTGAKTLVYNISADYDANTLGNTVVIENGSDIQIDAEVNLPFEGFGQINVFDTLSLSAPELPDAVEGIDSITLRIFTSNGMPASVDIQVEFLDDNGNVLDSLFSSGRRMLLSEPEINANGFVENPAESVVLFRVSDQKFNNIERSSQAKLRASIQTAGFANRQVVKLRESYSIDMRLGVLVNGTFEF